MDANRQIRRDVDFDSLYLNDEEATPRERTRYAEKDGKLKEAAEIATAIILLTNGRAAGIINGNLESVYGLNFDHIAADIMRQSGVDIKKPGFDLDRMLSKYTKRAYRREARQSYVSKAVENAIKTGVKKGEGILPIMRRVQKVSNRSRNSALTTAKTETFRMSSTGRNDCGREAYESGLLLNKVWHHSHVAKKPRDWHLAMDGETVDINEPFSNGLMHPHEAGAPAEEVINCYCDETLEVMGRWK